MPRSSSVRAYKPCVHPYHLNITQQHEAVVPRPQLQRPSGPDVVLHAVQPHGITHPNEGCWVMLPKEFDAILALEHTATPPTRPW
jgi:hypothetical protein